MHGSALHLDYCRCIKEQCLYQKWSCEIKWAGKPCCNSKLKIPFLVSCFHFQSSSSLINKRFPHLKCCTMSLTHYCTSLTAVFFFLLLTCEPDSKLILLQFSVHTLLMLKSPWTHLNTPLFIYMFHLVTRLHVDPTAFGFDRFTESGLLQLSLWP